MKLKHILPITTIAGVATVVAPIATSCSCSSNVIKLDKFVKSEEILGGYPALEAKNPINLVKGKNIE